MADPDRDPAVSRGYRALGGDGPPRALDESILAAARAEVEVRTAPLVAPTQRRHWYIPLAAAAVIVLSVAVTLNVERSAPDFESVPGEGSGESVRQPDATGAHSAPARDSPGSLPLQSVPTAPAGAEAVRAKPAVAPHQVEAPARESPAAASGRLAPEPARRESIEAPSEPAAARIAPAGTRSEVTRDRARESGLAAPGLRAPESSSPEAWLQRIAQLRRMGCQAEADESYAAFRRRYPGYVISDAMREQVLPR